MTRLDRIATHGARRSPDRIAIAMPGGRPWTYGELDRAASALARSLREEGAAPGDRLVLTNYNTPEFFVGLFGAARAGLVAVPLDPGLAPAELRNVIEHARPHAVVVGDRSAAIFEPLGVRLRRIGDETGAGDVGDDGGETGQEASPDPALILYTSGTTGTPRGAVHSHAGVLAKLGSIVSWFDLGEDDRSMCLLPTHFGHGLVCVCLSALHYGGTLVLCKPFDLEILPRVFALADEHQVTTFSTVPTIVRLLLRNHAIAPPASGRLRFVTCASAPLHPEEGEAFEARFGVPLLNCYGLTEGGTWSALSPVDPARDRRSVGTAIGCAFRAVKIDQDTGETTVLPAGEIGDLQVSGPSVMLGYQGDPEATARVLRDGWLSTGDLGLVDDGRPRLPGRQVQGAHHPRRRKHLPGRDRGRPAPPPGGGRGLRGRPRSRGAGREGRARAWCASRAAR